MISIKFKALEKLALDNSPVLLTAIGVAGVIGTAVLTHRAATKAERIKQAEWDLVDQGKRPSPEKRELFDITWKQYIPPVISGTVTVGCIVMANRIGTKRAAAMAAAYTILEQASNEYRDKVVERIGANEERKVRDEIAQDYVSNNPPREDNMVIVGNGNVLCCELYTRRYFESTVEDIKKAVNDTNYQINAHGYASLSDFYDRLGLPRTVVSEEMGWTSDKLMDVEFTGTIAEDGRPCVAINFVTGPVRDFHRVH